MSGLCRYAVFYEISGSEVGITNCGVNPWCELIAHARFQRTPYFIAAFPGFIPIETRVVDDTIVSVKGAKKTIRAAGQPEPSVAEFKSQLIGRLEVKFDFGRLDILIENILIC